jgi:hypothetical protein
MSETATAAPLRLRAEDSEDLAILSACLQDALVTVADMSYSPEERQFMLVVNRVRWEVAQPDVEPFTRVLAGIMVEGVTAARRRNIDPRRTDAMLSLLAICDVPGGVELIFAADAAIRLETAEIKVKLQDLGEEWPTLWRPSHDG